MENEPQKSPLPPVGPFANNTACSSSSSSFPFSFLSFLPSEDKGHLWCPLQPSSCVDFRSLYPVGPDSCEVLLLSPAFPHNLNSNSNGLDFWLTMCVKFLFPIKTAQCTSRAEEGNLITMVKELQCHHWAFFLGAGIT